MNELKLFERTEHSEWYVSPNGTVFMKTKYQGRDNKLKEKTPTLNKKRNYIYVRTPRGNHLLHRLVASSFIPNPDNKPCVNHKDGDKKNNHVNNLEWVTHKENTKHAIDNGLIKQQGKNEGRLKYTNQQCKVVVDRVKQGMSYVKAGSIYGMPYSTVAHLIRGSRRLI